MRFLGQTFLRSLTFTVQIFLGLVFTACEFKPNILAIQSQLMPYKTPVITSVEPTKLFTSGGTTLTVIGENFNSGTTITLAGKNCPIQTATNTTKLTCVTPSSAEGSFELVITQPNGAEAKSAVSYDGLAFSRLRILVGKLINPTSNSDGFYRSADSRGASQMLYDYENMLVYSADFNGHKIKETNLSTLFSKTIVGSGLNGTYDAAETDPTAADISAPTCLAKTGDFIYFCISDNTIGRLNTVTNVISVVVGYVEADSASPLDFVRQIYLVGNDLFVVDRDTIKKINLGTSLLTTVAGTAGASAIVDGDGTNGTFSFTSKSALLNGNLYVVDEANSYTKVLRKIDLSVGGDYAVSTVLGNPIALLFYGDPAIDGIGPLASMNDINDITIYGDKLIVLDTYIDLNNYGHYKIRLFNPATAEITTLFTIPATTNSVLGAINGSATITINTRGILYVENYGLLFGTPFGLLRLQ